MCYPFGFEDEGEPPAIACLDPVVPNDQGECEAGVDCGDIAFCEDPDGDPVTLTCVPPGPYPVGTTSVDVTCDDGEDSSTETCTVTVEDTEPPAFICAFEPVGDEDEESDGLYAILYSGVDNCDTDVEVFGYLDVYGEDETCDDQDPDLNGYPVENGDLVLLICDDEIECLPPDDDEDSDLPFIIRGPGLSLTVTGADDYGNEGEVECLEACVDLPD